jgi:hypothetical protein
VKVRLRDMERHQQQTTIRLDGKFFFIRGEILVDTQRSPERDGKLHILQPDAKGEHNDCLVCSNGKLPGGRKTTVCFCETCNRELFLHVGDCWKKYDT